MPLQCNATPDAVNFGAVVRYREDGAAKRTKVHVRIENTVSGRGTNGTLVSLHLHLLVKLNVRSILITVRGFAQPCRSLVEES